MTAAEKFVFMKLRIFWDVLPCSLLNVDIQLRTRQYIPEDSELHTRRRENLKSHNLYSCSRLISIINEPFEQQNWHFVWR
jgi:hypothetical protein